MNATMWHSSYTKLYSNPSRLNEKIQKCQTTNFLKWECTIKQIGQF